ncbi:ribbon-helix-helix protein, CopG family [Paracoccus alcaliphilus]|uniref:ribbon-helix-helix protein, CopG family n=2 Tax=Paracoccus alcaliphilus TaxID=34002 RepID=UPI0030B8158F
MQEKRKMGRPRLDTEPITLRLPRTMIETIDDLRRDEADLPTRPEMIRRLLERVIGKRET